MERMKGGPTTLQWQALQMRWGLQKADVSKCARGLQNQTGGYEFRFAEPESSVVEILSGWRVGVMWIWMLTSKTERGGNRHRGKGDTWKFNEDELSCWWVCVGYDDAIWLWFTSSFGHKHVSSFPLVINMGRHLKTPPFVLFHQKSSAWASDNVFCI